nr:hypothetical protein BaRGS_008741 [Batillaria attramentaria]
MRVQHLCSTLRCDAVAASRTQTLEDDWSQHLVVADGAPQHEAGPAPGVVFHNTVVSIAVTSSSPYPNTPVGMVNAETAFIAEKHVLPANIVPVEVALRPLQACLSMVHAELHTKCVTANSGFKWTASALMRLGGQNGKARQPFVRMRCRQQFDSAPRDARPKEPLVSDPNPPPKAKSFDTVLCLDISQSMWTGGAFDQMIDIANEFIDGIEDIVNDSGVEENIGLVTFGGRANVVQHLTNDFSRVRDAMERIVVSGKSPFYEAMVVSLVAFDGRGGTVSVSGEYDVRPRIIFISDGHITEASDDLDAQDRVIDAANTRAAFSRLMMDIAPSGDRGMPHPIIFIPVGTRADRGTIGKVIVTLQNKENGGTEDNIQAVVRALEPDLDDNEMSQVVKKVQEELSQPGRQKRRKSKPTDFDDVFEDKDPFTWVLWDSGEYNRYAYGSEMGFQVWKTDEHPRVKMGSEGLQVGMKVKKGPNWDSEDPKYGKGIGSVIRKSKDGQQIKTVDVMVSHVLWYFSDPFTEDQDEPAPRTLAEDLFGHKLNQDDSPNLDDEGMEDGELAWQWKDDWGRWRLYSDQNQAALEKAYKRKHDGTCVIQRGGQNFRVLFKRKSEKDLDTMIEREIKRVFLPFEEYESLRKVEEMI